jgi:hypothetical protein
MQPTFLLLVILMSIPLLLFIIKEIQEYLKSYKHVKETNNKLKIQQVEFKIIIERTRKGLKEAKKDLEHIRAHRLS